MSVCYSTLPKLYAWEAVLAAKLNGYYKPLGSPKIRNILNFIIYSPILSHQIQGELIYYILEFSLLVSILCRQQNYLYFYSIIRR